MIPGAILVSHIRGTLVNYFLFNSVNPLNNAFILSYMDMGVDTIVEKLFNLSFVIDMTMVDKLVALFPLLPIMINKTNPKEDKV